MGPRVYGISTEGAVWIQDRRASISVAWPKTLLYYMIIVLIYLYSIWANFQYAFQSKEDRLAKSFVHRQSIMKRSMKYTFGYVLYESITLFCEFLSFLFYQKNSILSSFASYFYCLQGLWDLTVIIYSNWSEITWANMNPFHRGQYVIAANVAQEGLLLHPHLNTALRTEILYFTTQGIMFAVQQQQQESDGELDREMNQINRKTFDEYQKLIDPITYSFENGQRGCVRT